MDGPTYLIVWNFVRILFALFVGTAAIVGYALTPLSIVMRLLYGFVALPIALPPESVHRRLHRQLHRHRAPASRSAGVRSSAAAARAARDRPG